MRCMNFMVDNREDMIFSFPGVAMLGDDSPSESSK